MYAVIIGIHLIFIFISYLLDYTLFEGIFTILCLFFLFYFSPLFFLESEENTISPPDGKYKKITAYILEVLDPKESLFIPLTLLYIALYGFIFFVFSDMNNSIMTHAIISIGIFFIGIGYAFSFSWKNRTFFEI